MPSHKNVDKHLLRQSFLQLYLLRVVGQEPFGLFFFSYLFFGMFLNKCHKGEKVAENRGFELGD